ncbi:serine hydrolase domain-containing protein [Ornithinibacillus contaminans]|uniref:serine hydrolase domain-containing protein n=1 Tax=Ornithinibacillus contaminans TaxID=694055 RepID=UPI00064DCD23|nr:serine hydrolase domain-containing protein [Ornithinibacillus contaminans]
MREKVLRFLQKEVDLNHIPGAVIHVSYQGNVLLQEAIGYRSVFPAEAPMKLDTVFDLASLTKVVATLPAVLKLMDVGELRLDDRVASFLPAFGSRGKEEVTIRHLLTHTSGLPAHIAYFKEKLNADQILDRICNQPLKNASGSKVVYSDLGLITLYHVIEVITGERFEDYVGREIFAPLGMMETGFNPTFDKSRYAVMEYSEQLQGYKAGIVHDENTESMGGISGHAGLFSTIQDLSTFARMIEQNGICNGKRILSEAGLRLSRKNYTPFDEEYRGLGWILKSPTYSSCGDYFSDMSYGHTGFTGTSIWFDPEMELHVILLTNRVHFGRKPAILRLRPRLHNLIRCYF